MKRRRKKITLSRIDKIRAYITEGTPTGNDDLDRTAERIQLIYPLLVQFPSTNKAVEQVMEQANCTQRVAFKLIQEAEKIYGLIRHRDKEGRKAILIDILYENLILAKEADDYNAVARISDKIAKMEGFYEHSDTVINLFQALELKPVVVTDNPAALEEPKEVLEIPSEVIENEKV